MAAAACYSLAGLSWLTHSLWWRCRLLLFFLVPSLRGTKLYQSSIIHQLQQWGEYVIVNSQSGAGHLHLPLRPPVVSYWNTPEHHFKYGWHVQGRGDQWAASRASRGGRTRLVDREHKIVNPTVICDWEELWPWSVLGWDGEAKWME